MVHGDLHFTLLQLIEADVHGGFPDVLRGALFVRAGYFFFELVRAGHNLVFFAVVEQGAVRKQLFVGLMDGFEAFCGVRYVVRASVNTATELVIVFDGLTYLAAGVFYKSANRAPPRRL